MLHLTHSSFEKCYVRPKTDNLRPCYKISVQFMTQPYSRLHIVLHNEIHSAAFDVTDSHNPTHPCTPLPWW